MGDFSALPGRAIVGGGIGGIGGPIVGILAARGSRVGFTYYGNASNAAELADGDVNPEQLDIVDRSSLR